jgi:hypothetical protein
VTKAGPFQGHTRTKQRMRKLILIGALATLVGAWTSVAVSQEQRQPDFSEFVWPDGYSQNDRTTALQELLADREADLTRVRDDIERFPEESSEAAMLRQKASALEDYVASLKNYLAQQG